MSDKSSEYKQIFLLSGFDPAQILSVTRPQDKRTITKTYLWQSALPPYSECFVIQIAKYDESGSPIKEEMWRYVVEAKNPDGTSQILERDDIDENKYKEYISHQEYFHTIHIHSYRFLCDGLWFDLCVYWGRLNGLCILSVKAGRKEDFFVPEWLQVTGIDEVTNDPRYKEIELARLEHFSQNL